MTQEIMTENDNRSKAELVASLTQEARLALFSKYTDEELDLLQSDWDFWARPNQKLPPGNWFTWLLLAGRGFGKALPIDTPIPTPDGWKTMEELQPGDRVFDDNGNPCNVTFITPVQYDRDCYEILFDDGKTVIADAEHQWSVSTHKLRKKHYRNKKDGEPPTVIMTTIEMVENLYHSARKDCNLAIRITEPLKYDKKDLPIAPYALGVWLGDGDSKAAYLTIGDNDIEILDYFQKYYKVKKSQSRDITYSITEGDGRRFPEKTFHYKLRKMSLMKNKHIPDIYLQSTIEDRLELLQGLMDTDGYVNDKGFCEYCSCNEKLAYDAYELILSLGIKASIYEHASKLYGKYCGKRYRISFKGTLNVFKLKRKAVLIADNHDKRLKRRMIRKITKVDSVPVKCIQVDSPSSLYLCTDFFLVTHNTRVSSEAAIFWQNPKKQTHSAKTIKGYSRFALIGQTTADIRDIMLFGDSGIISCAPKYNKPEYIASRRVVEWPNGAQAHLYSGDEPDQLRGPQHEKAIIDELMKFEYPDETWDNMELGLRLGDKPQCVVATTPKPKKILKEIVADPDTYITSGSSYENVGNLSQFFIKRVIKKYEGTRLGQQELHAKILGDAEGALWSSELLEKNRVDVYPSLRSVVVSIDPSVTNKDESDECGIVVAGRDRFDRAFVLEDGSGKMDSKVWAQKAINLYHKHRADYIVAEVNNGGDLVKTVINLLDPKVPVETVWASRDKYTRATPVASIYEQDRVCHVGLFPKLEEELVEWEPGTKSPNRLDALVWAITWLLLGEDEVGTMTAIRRPF